MKTMTFAEERIAAVRRLYDAKATLYHYGFVKLMGYEKNLRRFFRRYDFGPDFKFLDAGCGTGAVTRALYAVGCREKKYNGLSFYAFDMTPAMLAIFRRWIKAKDCGYMVFTEQANVLDLDPLPSNWRRFDRVVTSGMLEHLPSSKLTEAIHNLNDRLSDDGAMLAFVTKQNFITSRFSNCIKNPWQTNIYGADVWLRVFRQAGFSRCRIITSPSCFLTAIEAKK